MRITRLLAALISARRKNRRMINLLSRIHNWTRYKNTPWAKDVERELK